MRYIVTMEFRVWADNDIEAVTTHQVDIEAISKQLNGESK